MTDRSDLPAEIQSWLGEKRYEQVGEFDVERGYIFTTCSSVQNGNPIFWDDKAAAEITGGPIAPPAMMAAFELPDAVMSDNTVTFGEPVRPGDRLRTWQVLRNVSTPKKTKLGTGRFWDIDVEYVNQRGEWVGTESYTGFGYRRD